MEIKTGQIVLITTGEYSDYGVCDYLRALRDFDDVAEARRFVAEGDYLAPPSYDPEAEPEDWDSDARFLAWCIRENLLEPLPTGTVTHMHLGAYSRLELHERGR